MPNIIARQYAKWLTPHSMAVTDRLLLSIESDRIGLLLAQGFFRSEIVFGVEEPVQLNPADPQQALEIIETILADSRLARRRCPVNVTVSDQLVRYFVFERTRGIRNKQSLASRFEAIYGQTADEWQLETNIDPQVSSTVACAVSMRLSAGLRKLISPPRFRLMSLQPYLVREFNRLRVQMRSRKGWLAVAEHGSVSLGLIDGSNWMAVRTHRLKGPVQDELPALIGRESLLLGINAASLPIWLGGFAIGEDETPENDAITVMPAPCLTASCKARWNTHRLALSAVER
jgi:hypothetical protein